MKSSSYTEALARLEDEMRGFRSLNFVNGDTVARWHSALQDILAASKAEAEEMVPVFGNYSLPRWLLESAARIERYMAAHHTREWVIGGIQSRVEPKAGLAQYSLNV